MPPATHIGSPSSSTGPPYGTHLRLKASFAPKSTPSAGAATVLKALQTYGAIVSDGSDGNEVMEAEDDANYPAGTKWESYFSDVDRADAILSDLQGVLTWSDFEVVDYDVAHLASGSGSCARVTPSFAAPGNPIFAYHF